VSLQIVTFATDDAYLKRAKIMAHSAGRFDYPVKIYTTKDRGGWHKNMQMKVQVILAALDEHVGTDILYLDADSVMVNKPIELDGLGERADLAGVLEPRRYVYGSTIWVRNCPAGMKAMRRWLIENEQHPDEADDQNLLYSMRGKTGVRFHALPHAYAWTPKIHRPRFPRTKPVILHEMCVTLGDRKKRNAEVKMRPWI
jgi:hypothetical protein